MNARGCGQGSDVVAMGLMGLGGGLTHLTKQIVTSLKQH